MKILKPGMASGTKWWEAVHVTCLGCGCTVEFEANDPVRSTAHNTNEVTKDTRGVYLPCPTEDCGKLLCVFLGRTPEGWWNAAHTTVQPR